MMRTRFKRHVSSRPASVIAGLRQCYGLGVRPPTGLGPAAPDNPVALHDHTTNRRIWPNHAQPTLSEGQSQCHKAVVGVGHSSGAMCGRNSLTKSSKSSAAWKFL